MTQREIILKTQIFVKEKFGTENTGHDWWHIYRVWKLSKYIAKKEKGVDKFIVELGALLHDIADWKFHNGDLEAGPKAVRKWLETLNVEDKTITHIEDIARNVSFKGAKVKSNLTTKEGKIVSDADKLDAIGAIGIGRAFAYGGANKRPMYDPNIKPEKHSSFEAYKNSNSSTINHFYEKLLLLKSHMFTKTAKEIADKRIDLMKNFLKEFKKEWKANP